MVISYLGYARWYHIDWISRIISNQLVPEAATSALKLLDVVTERHLIFEPYKSIWLVVWYNQSVNQSINQSISQSIRYAPYRSTLWKQYVSGWFNQTINSNQIYWAGAVVFTIFCSKQTPWGSFQRCPSPKGPKCFSECSADILMDFIFEHCQHCSI